MSTENSALNGTAQTLRPSHVHGMSAQEIVEYLKHRGFNVDIARGSATVTGITMDSREVQSGDLYVALPGAKAHGAQFISAAVSAGAVAVLTDSAGVAMLGEHVEQLAVIQCEELRAAVGPLSAEIYGSQPHDGSAPTLLALTGTNGKTTTTYMVNSLMEQLGHTTGLIGTIEILAGGAAIPSKLTTPESTHVHSLLSLMREQGISSMSMEVSSHALDYRRVDGVRYDVAGFTNLTQDHLDQHGTMENYCASKAALFTPERSRRAVITADDEWGEKMLGQAIGAMGIENVVALFTHHGAGFTEAPHDLANQDWALIDVRPEGIGHTFSVVRGDGVRLDSSTQLPADFNVSNAALAAVMVYESGADQQRLTEILAERSGITPVVPGRMQLISTEPTVLVDFAHNPDALQRALQALHSAEQESKVIVVFGATGERDQTKRPIMGDIAARFADIVIVTDDDPHDEPAEPIRDEIFAGAKKAQEEGARVREILNISPRAEAISRAIELAGPHDAILVAGRGHEVAQEVSGVNHDLDDRIEVARALLEHDYDVHEAYRPTAKEAK